MSLASLPTALAALPNPLGIVPSAINHLLKREKWARSALLPYAGQAALLVLAPFELCLAVDSSGLIELADAAVAPAVRIDLPATALPHLLTGQGQDGLIKQVKLEGDAQFAQVIARLAQGLRWEPEEDLSRFVGDIAAKRSVDTLRALGAQAREGTQRLAQSLAEYLLEENPQLVRPRQIEPLATGLRTLRDDMARLEKRLDRLAGK